MELEAANEQQRFCTRFMRAIRVEKRAEVEGKESERTMRNGTMVFVLIDSEKNVYILLKREGLMQLD